MYMAVLNTLKETREQNNLLQKELAQATGYSVKTIGRIERGEQYPSVEFALRMAAYFNVLVEDMFKIENV